MTYDQYKPAFDRDGFVVVRQFLTPGELTSLAKNLDRYIREVVPTLPDAEAFYQDKSRPETLKQLQHMGLDPFFHEYKRHPRWNALATALVGETVEVQDPEWFNKPPGTDHATPPHQDNYYFKLEPSNVATLWLALETVDEENGCLRYVPRSHLPETRPHGASQVLGFSQGITDYGSEDLVREVAIELEPGDLVAHHGQTIHRADANRSTSRTRRAFAMVCQGVSCRRNEAAIKRHQAVVKVQHDSMGLKT